MARSAGIHSWGTTRLPAWIDFDNDGDVDLFVAFRDRPNMLFRNDRGRFTDVAPSVGLADPRKTVGAVWFDMDQDGDLDLALADNGATGKHFLCRNDLASPGSHSIAVLVLDEHARYSRAGSQVRAFAAGSRRLLAVGMVDIEVTTLRGGSHHVTRVPNMNASSLAGKPLIVKAGPAAQ